VLRFVLATAALSMVVGCSNSNDVAPSAVTIDPVMTLTSWISVDDVGSVSAADLRAGTFTDYVGGGPGGGPTGPFPALPGFSSTVREQAGLLGVAEVDGVRYVAYTRTDGQLVVVGQFGVTWRIVWEGTSTRQKAIGGHLEAYGSLLLLGLGELTGWAKEHGSGALVTLDPLGNQTQEPVVLTDGWHNPFAFAVGPDHTTVWVADNAPDGGVERLGRGDLQGVTTDLPGPQRAPSALAILPDGRLAVCGWLDRRVRRYATTSDTDKPVTVRRTDTIAEGCATGLLATADSLYFSGDDGLQRVRLR
jgi:hypothetical protein